MSAWLKRWLSVFAPAAVLALLFAGPAAVGHSWDQPIRLGSVRIGILPTMLFLAATPIVRGVRAGESVMAHPIALALRIAFLTLVAAGWLFMLWDQMPCLLGGVPGCD